MYRSRLIHSSTSLQQLPLTSLYIHVSCKCNNLLRTPPRWISHPSANMLKVQPTHNYEIFFTRNFFLQNIFNTNIFQFMVYLKGQSVICRSMQIIKFVGLKFHDLHVQVNDENNGKLAHHNNNLLQSVLWGTSNIVVRAQ